MTKKRDIILTVLFSIYIGMMAVMIAVLPKQTVSENEKRTLAQFPKFSVERIMAGRWESDFETYISDHFPARNTFASLDAYHMLLTGRNGSNGVYKGKDGYLINTPVKYDYDTLYKNISAVNEFAKKTGIKTKLIAVPSTGYIMSDKLPDVHMEYKDEEIRYAIEQITSPYVEMIDIASELMDNKDTAQLYYKTDHHWTSEGAYIAYKKWAKSEGLTAQNADEYMIEKTDGFYGTTYTKSALWNEKSDIIEIWEYPINVTVTIDDENEYNSMFFREHLEKMDKYPVFLDGNHGFERITNHDNPDGKKMLVIKDSYAHCFVPFMMENAAQTDMVDLRYYLDSVSELTAENEYDEILVIYSLSNLCEANDLSVLQ